MQSCRTTIALCLLVAACDVTPRSPIAPDPPDTTVAASYVVRGRVFDLRGAPQSGATVLLENDNRVQTTVTDANGDYRFDGVRGRILVIASKEDSTDAREVLWVSADQTVDLTLRSVLVLTVGTPLRAATLSPCDPNWDARAPCASVYFTPPASGRYEFVLTFDGRMSELDLLIDQSNDLYWVVTSDPNRIRGTFAGTAGIRREIHVHSYYGPAAFALTVQPVP